MNKDQNIFLKTALIGSVFFGIASFWQLFESVVPLQMQTEFHWDDTAIGGVIAVFNLIGGALLPVFGARSDQSTTKLGKRIPFILSGSAAAILGVCGMAFAGTTGQKLLYLGALLLSVVAMGIYKAPAMALIPDEIPQKYQVASNAMVNFLGALGGIYTLFLIRVYGPQANNRGAGEKSLFLPFLGVAVALLAGMICQPFLWKRCAVYKTKIQPGKDPTDEKRAVDQPKSPAKILPLQLVIFLLVIVIWFAAYNGFATSFSRFAVSVWQMHNGEYAQCLIYTIIGSMLGYFIMGLWMRSFGKKQSMLAGLIIMGVSFWSIAQVAQYSRIAAVLFVLLGFGHAAVNVNAYPMLISLCNAGEIGKYTGVFYASMTAAQCASPLILGFATENMSYRVLFPCCTLAVCLAFVAMLFVKSDKGISTMHAPSN